MNRFLTLAFSLIPVLFYGQTFRVDKSEIDLQLHSGDVSQDTLLITNERSNPLKLVVSTESPAIVFFEKNDFADWTMEANQDSIAPSVSLTRANSQGLFNITQETGYTSYEISPKGTEWSYGRTNDLIPGSYKSWAYAVQGSPPNMVDRFMSVHVIQEDIYYDIQWHSWTSGGEGGGFSYSRYRLDHWLAFDHDTLTIDPGQNARLIVFMNAENRDSGNLTDSLIIRDIQDANNVVKVPINLEVLTSAGIFYDGDTINFGEVFLGDKPGRIIEIENRGNSDLIVTQININSDVYSIDKSVFGVDPGEKELLTIEFSPKQLGNYDTELILTSNDPSDNPFTIPIHALSVDPPIMNITTDTIQVDLVGEEIELRNITIENQGSSTLNYSISNSFIEKPQETGMNAREGGISLTFTVNMAYQAEVGIFDPETETVDIAGTFNNWGGTTNQLDDLNGDLIYQTTIDGFFPGDQIEFKFRQNAKWDGTEEFPGGGPNRQYTVIESKQLYYWYNEQKLASDQPFRLIYTDPNEAGQSANITNVYARTDEQFVTIKLESNRPLPSEMYFWDYITIVIDRDQKPNTGQNLEYLGWPEIGAEYSIEKGYSNDYQVYDLNDGVVVTNVDSYSFPEYMLLTFDYTLLGLSSEFNMGIIQGWEDFVPDENHSPIQVEIIPMWLEESPSMGSIGGGDEKVIEISFNSSGLPTGVYESSVLIESNDPLNGLHEIYTRMNVVGVPGYSGPDKIDFSTAYQGVKDSTSIILRNIGFGNLQITSIESGNAAVTASSSSLSIPPQSETVIYVFLNSEATGNLETNLLLTTNDPANLTVELPVYANLIGRPILQLSSESISETIRAGESVSNTFQVLNAGEGALAFQLIPPQYYSVDLNRLSSGIELSNTYSLKPVEGLTISMWLYLDEDPDCNGMNNWRMILNKGSVWSGYGFNVILEDNGHLNWSLGVEEGTLRYESNRSLPMNEWVFASFTYDGQNPRIYFDGEEIAGTKGENLSGDILYYDDNIVVNGWSYEECQEGNGVFPGYLAELRFWNYPRTEVEMSTTLNKKLKGDEEGLLGYWVFDSGNGDMTNDLSGHNGAAYMYGTSWKTSAPYDWIQVALFDQEIEEALSIDLSLNANQLREGIYSYDLKMRSNDPYQAEFSLPVNLNVLAPLSIVDQTTPELLINAYPNPFTEVVYFEVSDPSYSIKRITVYDMTGKKVYSKECKEERNPSWKGYDSDKNILSKGMYQIRLELSNGSFAQTKILLNR